MHTIVHTGTGYRVTLVRSELLWPVLCTPPSALLQSLQRASRQISPVRDAKRLQIGGDGQHAARF